MTTFQNDDFLYYKTSGGAIIREGVTVEKNISSADTGVLTISTKDEDMGVVMYSLCEKKWG